MEDSNIDLSPKKRIGALITTVVSCISSVHEQFEVGINESCYGVFRRITPVGKITGADWADLNKLAATKRQIV